jgi:hypothetical protein
MIYGIGHYLKIQITFVIRLEIKYINILNAVAPLAYEIYLFIILKNEINAGRNEIRIDTTI